jgi:hypothetical protein
MQFSCSFLGGCQVHIRDGFDPRHWDASSQVLGMDFADPPGANHPEDKWSLIFQR